MTITNITPRETELQRELSLARGEASVWKDQVTYDQAELKTVWRMNDALKAEVAALKANLEKEQSLTAHHRTTQVELLSKVAELKAQLGACEKVIGDSIDNNIDKLMAMSDEQVRALSAFEGHNPDDDAKIVKQAAEIAILKHKLSEKQA